MAKSRTIHVYYIIGCSLLLVLILSSLGIIRTRTSEESLLPATDTWWGPTYGPPVQERVVVVDGGWNLGGAPTIATPPIPTPPIPNPVPAPPPIPPMPPILSVSTYT